MFFKRRKTFEEKVLQIEQEETRWMQDRQLLIRREAMEEDKAAFKKQKRKRGNRLSTSKLLISFLFVNCTVIEIFTGWIMAFMITNVATAGGGFDFTPLVALIGAVVGEVIGYAIYSIKAMKENTKGGLIYDSAMMSNVEEEQEEE